MKRAYLFFPQILGLLAGVGVAWLHEINIFRCEYEILEYIITVDSIVLGVVTLTLTIIMTIRDAKIYRKAKERRPEIIQQIYDYSTSALFSSIISIIVSILILLAKEQIEKNNYMKIGAILLSVFFFVKMLAAAVLSYWQSIQLLRLDDE